MFVVTKGKTGPGKRLSLCLASGGKSGSAVPPLPNACIPPSTPRRLRFDSIQFTGAYFPPDLQPPFPLFPLSTCRVSWAGWRGAPFVRCSSLSSDTPVFKSVSNDKMLDPGNARG